MSEIEAEKSRPGDPDAHLLSIAAKAYLRGLDDREPTNDEALAALREMSEGIDITRVKFGDELYTATPLRKLVEIAFASSPTPDHWSEAVKRFLAPAGAQTDPHPLTEGTVVADAATPLVTPAKQPGEGRSFWVILTLGASAALGVWIWGELIKVTAEVPTPPMTVVTPQQALQRCRMIRLTVAMSGRPADKVQDAELARCG